MNSEKAIISILMLVVAVSGCTQTESREKGDKAVIDRVIDGDTVEADVRNHTVTIRLQGVDTPEVHAENTPEDWDCDLSKNHLREYGHKASKYVKENLANQTVRIIYSGKGYYGRTIGTIRFNDTTLAKELLENGLAQTYMGSNYTEKSSYLQLESEIRRKEIGVWSRC